MPLENKTKWAKLRVGLMAIVSMVILGILIFLITGNLHLFEAKAELYTFLSDTASLTEKSGVRLNGIPIGQVKKITFSGSRDPRRVVKVDIQVTEKMLQQIPIDSIAGISASNVLGDKFLNIKKGVSSATVRPGQEIPSVDTREFEDVVQQGYALLTSLQGILQRVDKIVGLVEAGHGSIGKLLVDEELYARILGVVNQGERIAAALNSDRGTLGKLLYSDQLYQEVRVSLARMDSLLQGLEEGQGAAGRFLKDPALYDDAQRSIVEVRALLADLNAGKGTAGKLLKSDELHQQVAHTIDRLDATIDRINSGQGTVGQLLVNPALYDSMNGATRELHELFKDFRANPKKFLRIKLAIF